MDGMDSSDRALKAFLRLLADAAGGGQSKVDALVALSQRTILVPTWTFGGDDYRPLISSDGQNALPLFTSFEELAEAARRFGWMQADGTVAHKEVGSRAVFRHALAHQLSFVVVDITAEHALEIERSEIEPLLESHNRSDSSGAFAGVGRISEMMLQKVRSSSFPAPPEKRPITTPVIDHSTIPSPPPSQPPVALDGDPTSVQIVPLSVPPSDLLLDAASAVLRSFPEVEWAGYLYAGRNGAPPGPTFGLRIADTYRDNVQEIRRALIECADKHALTMDILLLDDPELTRTSREHTLMFFPWRQRNEKSDK